MVESTQLFAKAKLFLLFYFPLLRFSSFFTLCGKVDVGKAYTLVWHLLRDIPLEETGFTTEGMGGGLECVTITRLFLPLYNWSKLVIIAWYFYAL